MNSFTTFLWFLYMIPYGMALGSLCLDEGYAPFELSKDIQCHEYMR
jgi:hypothetical protein